MLALFMCYFLWVCFIIFRSMLLSSGLCCCVGSVLLSLGFCIIGFRSVLLYLSCVVIIFRSAMLLLLLLSLDLCCCL